MPITLTERELKGLDQLERYQQQEFGTAHASLEDDFSCTKFLMCKTQQVWLNACDAWHDMAPEQ